jgi:hypothetical protein
MESNLLLVFADETKDTRFEVQTMFQQEWNAMCKHAASAEEEEMQPLKQRLRMLLPLIRRFF